MTDRKINNNIITGSGITAMLLVLLCILSGLLLAGCSETHSIAEEAVMEQLESMRYIEFEEASAEELLSMLSDEGRDHFYEFKEKAGKYDYEILGSSEAGDDATIVTVQIKTYSFGRIYLETWADYLESTDASGSKNDGSGDQAIFYEALMKNLSEADDKNYIAEVEILCGVPDGTGEMQTDALTNAPLRDAIFGGMLTEIASLAG